MMSISGRKKKQLTAQNFKAGQLSVDLVLLVHEYWFLADSLAQTLGYSDTAAMLDKLPADEMRRHKLHTDSNKQPATLVNEAGFLRAVVLSQADTAEPLKRWMVYDVLPKMRLTGQYKAHQMADAFGVKLNFTAVQWDWLRLNAYLVDVIPMALAGYGAAEIAVLVGQKRITIQKQLEKLRSLGYIPKAIPARLQQLEDRIRAERKPTI